MARPREPVEFIAEKGRKHLTKQEYEDRKKTEVSAKSDDVKAPSFLSKKEKELFDYYAKQLIEIGIMTNLDCDALARYIVAEGEYEKLTKQVKKVKFMPDKKSRLTAEQQMENQLGNYGYLSKLQIKAMKACNECARELGLTISSRCRLVMPKEKEEKPVNKFMKHA